jgi:hypothetical protein
MTALGRGDSEGMEQPEPTLTQIRNGWHCGSPALNLTVRGDTREEAQARYWEAARKAAEIRSRPDSTDPAIYLSWREWGTARACGLR